MKTAIKKNDPIKSKSDYQLSEEHFHELKFENTEDAFRFKEFLQTNVNLTAIGVYSFIFKSLPSVYEFDYTSSKLNSKWLRDIIEKGGFKIIHLEYEVGLRNKKMIRDVIMINTETDCMIMKYYDYNVRLSYNPKMNSETLQKYYDLVRSSQSAPPKKKTVKNRIFMLNVVGSGMKAKTVFSSFQFRPFKVDIKLNYNEDFQEVHKYILKRLKQKDDKGIVLLHGEAGTGKTFYMRQLCKVVGKKILYIPSSMVHYLTDPSMMSILKKHKNSILVVEDADNIVRKRDEFSDQQTVSTILNLGDGMLNDILNIQVVLSFNTDIKNIDPALMREDRLIAEYKFEKLKVEKAQELSNSIGYDFKIEEPMTLAQVYTQGNPRHMSSRDELKIGFKK